MKHSNVTLYKIIAGTTMAVAMLTSCKDREGQRNQHADHAAVSSADPAFSKPEVAAEFKAYLQLKDALVASDPEAAVAAAASMKAYLGEDPLGAHEELTAIAQTEDVEKQRAWFKALNHKLEPVLRDHLSNGTVYKQFCPMAFNNLGGYWFSDSDTIRNPYFGDVMLSCGRVVEEMAGR